MKNILIGLLLAAGLVFLIATKDNPEQVIPQGSDYQISIVKGDNYLHKFNLFWFINTKNPPQIAVWSEDSYGNYLETIYITERTQKQNWRKAPGDDGDISRPESLPVWSNKVQNKADIISSASVKEDINLKIKNSDNLSKIFIEVNHSTDFNEYFSKEARENEINYSGGQYGSGQPSLIYKVNINKKENFRLIGNGHPSGKDGEIYNMLDKIDSAKKIITPKISFKEKNND